jgi:hypothetical protein
VNIKGAFVGSILGGAIASVINIGLYFVGQAIGANYIPNDTSAFAVLGFQQAVVIGMIAAVMGFLVFAALTKIAKDKAWPAFLAISALVFAVEIYFPFASFADGKTILILELMHVPVAVLIVLGIRKGSQR